jgi:hypothetical protein
MRSRISACDELQAVGSRFEPCSTQIEYVPTRGSERTVKSKVIVRVSRPFQGINNYYLQLLTRRGCTPKYAEILVRRTCEGRESRVEESSCTHQDRFEFGAVRALLHDQRHSNAVSNRKHFAGNCKRECAAGSLAISFHCEHAARGGRSVQRKL